MNEGVPLPPRPKARRNETRDLTTPIRAALNRLPGVRVIRNTDRGKMVPYHDRLSPHPAVILTGLGEGSCDLVGIVSCEILGYTHREGSIHPAAIGRAFAVEVKWHDASTEPRRARLQRLWRAAFQRFGGFATEIRCRDAEHGIALAIEAVKRCRDGASE